MASGGNTNGNGNGNGKWKKFTVESVGLGVAEFVSIGVSLGVVAVADQVAPNLLKQSGKAVGKILEPYLDTIEKGMKKFCKLEECQPDETKPREERAEHYGKIITIFSSAFLISLAAKLATRTSWNHFFLPKSQAAPKTGKFFTDHIKPRLPTRHDWKIIGLDEGIHIGSFLLMNIGMARHTDDWIKVTSKILRSYGWSEQKSKEIASMGVIWEVPNILGFAAGVGGIAHDTFRGGNGKH